MHISISLQWTMQASYITAGLNHLNYFGFALHLGLMPTTSVSSNKTHNLWHAVIRSLAQPTLSIKWKGIVTLASQICSGVMIKLQQWEQEYRGVAIM